MKWRMTHGIVVALARVWKLLHNLHQRGGIMGLSQIRDRGLHPQSVALAHVTLEALLRPNCKAAEGPLQVARDERKEELEHDPLGSARGIVNGLRLSVTLWSFVTLVVLLTR